MWRMPAGHAARARDVIGRQLEHVTRLVDDLLDVSRVAAARVLTRRTVDPSDVATAAVGTPSDEVRRTAGLGHLRAAVPSLPLSPEQERRTIGCLRQTSD